MAGAAAAEGDCFRRFKLAAVSKMSTATRPAGHVLQRKLERQFIG